MKLSPKIIFALLAFALGSLFGGCTVESPRDSSIPWNRPADWEGQIPGMGMGGGMGGGPP